MGQAEEESTRTRIAHALDLDHQYSETVASWDQERIDLTRRLGRAVGRAKGWRIRTLVVDHHDEPLTRVWVVVIEGGDAEDEVRLQERTRLLLNEAFKDLLPPDDR